MQLACVPPDRVEEVWPHVRHFFVKACKRGRMQTFKTLEDSILDGQRMLWLATDGHAIHAAAATEIHQTEWEKHLVIVACGGVEMRKWLWILDGIEAYGREEGCDAVRFIGRRGWARALPNYRCTRVVLERRLK